MITLKEKLISIDIELDNKERIRIDCNNSIESFLINAGNIVKIYRDQIDNIIYVIDILHRIELHNHIRKIGSGIGYSTQFLRIRKDKLDKVYLTFKDNECHNSINIRELILIGKLNANLRKDKKDSIYHFEKFDNIRNIYLHTYNDNEEYYELEIIFNE